MSGFLLDTNTCIFYLNQRSTLIQSRIQSNLDKIWLCDIVEMELYYGAYKSQAITKNLANLSQFLMLFPILNYNSDVAKIAGEVRADLAKKGTPIGAYDLLISATALYYDKTVITDNIREFSRVKNLNYQNWLV